MTMFDIDPQNIDSLIRHVAATEVMPRFRNLKAGDFREKKPGDFVTVADEESEKILSRLLAEALPGALVVGEEAVSKDKSVLGRLKADAPVWVIDPIDGTSNFLHGREEFGILIALMQGGVTRYAWAFDAPGDRMAFAARGKGAWLDGAPLKISCAKTEMSELVGQGGGAPTREYDPVRPLFRDLFSAHSALHDYMNVFSGRADFTWHRSTIRPWDHAAVCLIAQEAGGYVAQHEDDPYDPAYLGPGFLLAAPSKAWRDRIYAVFHEKLARK